MSDKTYNYKDKGANKLSDDFKKVFMVNIKGKEAIKLEGLTALAHEKGMWKLETTIIQFPTQENNFTCICQTTVGGYDYDPVTDKIREVVYTDIGDANVNNCTKMVAASFIRMASTRSQARALRKYTNVDMVCTSEMDSVTEDPPEPIITTEQLTTIKESIKTKKLTPETFGNMLFKMFGHQNYMQLTQSQGNTLINALTNYVIPQGQNTPN